MNAQTKIEASPLAKLREPFADNHISKLPKPSKAQTQAIKDNFKAGIRCKLCGSWHHPDVVHLDYVGHAALTDRLLDTDPEWFWEPLAFTDGLPAFDKSGGLWIRLTVCGVTRLGYGHAASKPGIDPGAREKEVIGDALRNAAMRFGAALDLWHKGVLHADDGDDAEPAKVDEKRPEPVQLSKAQWTRIVALLEATKSNTDAMLKFFKVKDLKQLTDAQAIKVINQLEDKLAKMAKAETDRASEVQSDTPAGEFDDLAADDIPY